MKSNPETEITFYSKIGDPLGLSHADEVEDHVQLESRLIDSNKIRVRKTTKQPSNNVEYVCTCKRKDQNVKNPSTISDSIEYHAKVDEAFFVMFEKIMEQKIEKRRFTFKNRSINLILGNVEEPIHLEHVGFEVDYFLKDGKRSEYVKIDVEVDQIIAYIDQHYPDLKSISLTLKLNNLPFKPIDVIYPPNASDEQKALIKNLWDTQFTTKREEPSNQ